MTNKIPDSDSEKKTKQKRNGTTTTSIEMKVTAGILLRNFVVALV